MRRSCFTRVACCIILILCGSEAALDPATAQGLARGQAAPDSPSPASPAWEIELRGGGISGSALSSGSPSFPDPGVPFLTFSGRPTRHVSSWYFGDGAQLLTQALQSFGLVTSLDPVLHAPVARRQRGASLGVRVSRRLSRRVRAEVSLDYSLGQLAFNRNVLQVVEASRVGFVATFRTFPILASSTSSTASIRDVAGREILTTASLAIDLKRRGDIIPFVIGGAGVISRRGDPLSVSLRGDYVLGTFAPAPFPARQIVESDTVNIRYTLADYDVVAVAGAGIRYALSPRWVVRLEARGYFSRNRLRIAVDATPHTVPAAPGTGSALVFATIPALQFSNASQFPSTLSGAPLVDFVTFTGRGMQSRASLTAGLGWRF